MVNRAKRELLLKGIGAVGLASFFAASPVSAVGLMKEPKTEYKIVKDEKGRIVQINEVYFNPENPMDYERK